jgi:hypothetical protein
LSTQANAATSQNASNPSSSAVRLSTIERPSSASSRPATVPSSVERNSRRATNVIKRTDSVPNSATPNRQPNGVRPKIHSPRAIIHLPIGGCTTYDGSVPKMSVRPASIWASMGVWPSGTVTTARS